MFSISAANSRFSGVSPIFTRPERVALLPVLALLTWSQCLAAPDPGRLEEVQVTAGRVEQTTSEVSTGVSVIGQEEILASAPALPTDLLRGLPGAFVQQTTPGQGVPIVRGLKGSEVLHLVDGMRLNNAFFRNAPNQYVALVDPRILSRIEVVRGPAPALYGSDAMGGVVQMVTALPEIGVVPRFSGRAQLDYRSGDDALASHVTVNRSGRRLGYTLSGSYLDVNQRTAGGGRELAHSAFTSRAARAAVRALPHDDHELLLDLQYLRQPGTPRHDELVAGFGQDEPASAVFSFEPNDRLFAHARHNWNNVSTLVDNVEFHVGLQVMHDDRLTRDTGSRSLRRERNKSQLFGFTTQAQTLRNDHRLTYGLEYYADEVSSRRDATDILTGTTEAIGSRFPDGSTMDSVAIYLHDAIQLGERTELDLGARYSRFDVFLPSADRGIGADLSLDDLTADAGLLFLLRPGLRLVANLGRGFRAPNIFDLGTLGPRPGNRFNTPNPNLMPERVVTADLGLKWQGARLVAEAMVWTADYRDKIDSVPTGEVDASGRTIVQSRNTASADLWGVEAGAHLLSADGRLEMTGVLNLTRGEQRDGIAAAQPADRIPPLNGEIGIRFRPRSNWWVEANSRFASSQDRLSDRDRGDPRIDPNGTADWVALDLTAGWRFSRGADLTLRLENVLDASYREHASGIDATGRSLGFSLTARF